MSRQQANNYINHIAVLLDKSTSMRGLEAKVIKAVDSYIAHLARRSQEMAQETRISVYTFADSDNITCVIFDMDVVRLPSIAEFYDVHGNTALVDATLLAIRDLQLTCVKYGQHGFMVVAFTDGEENHSREKWTFVGHQRIPILRQVVEKLPENWTVAALVPGFNARQEAEAWGFPKGNIDSWDTTSSTGVEEAISKLTTATDNYMTMRTTGQSGTRKLFSTSKDAVNAATVQAAARSGAIAPLAKGTYDLIAVPRLKAGQGILNKDKKPVWELKGFVEFNGLRFQLGRNFYRLSKKEKIAGDKQLVIVEKATNKVFSGEGVRAMIGLADGNVSVAPDQNPDFSVFVQSKSNNRHLFAGDEIIVLH